MFVVDLRCEVGHLFEGWYDNLQGFEKARDDGALSCAVCGSTRVEQRLTTRGVLTHRTAEAAPPLPARMPLELQRALSKLLHAVRTNTEDVGDRFAATALAMHQGEREVRAIHGTSTPEEDEELVEHGVPFVKIPVPDIDQN